ncbi:3D domain-containing protein [Clostridioides mangenotii]|uniref:3D domain-containing protein n=1 Tax=Metaclostridioides mangenotii TaxID=1540 RepID=UPI001C129433|nr:3D domain-containing protein [Clostridioides mangenotii]MBU5307672.1 G5 domain-containing protein [Clostridioides mangenotii]MCR1954095.1 3D domain-containing protein [Clostridioides mangenotii]
MSFKKMSNLKVSALAVVLSVGILSGYSMINKEITLVVNGEETKVSTLKSDVKSILEDQKVKYDDNDIVSTGFNKKLASGDRIEVINVEEKTVKEKKEIPFLTEVIKNANSTSGKTEVKEEGKAGENEVVYKLTYHNGDLVNKEYVKEIVKTKPVNKVVKEVADVDMQVATSRGTSSRNLATSSSKTSTSQNGQSMKVVATAYSGHSITATGTKPKWGTIAVDPKVIPYGTKVYIPQFDMVFTAEDCGSAIKGNKIDIFMNDSSTVYNWGRKTIDIRILGK